MMDQETKESIGYWVKMGLFLLVVGAVAVACFASTRWQAADKAIIGVNFAVIELKDDEAADPRSLTDGVIAVAVRGDNWSLFWPEEPSYEEQAERALILAYLRNGWATEASRIASNSRFFASAVEVARDEAKAILQDPWGHGDKEIVDMYRTLREPIVTRDDFDELVVENDKTFDPCQVLKLATGLDLLSEVRTWDASERTNFRGCWKLVMAHIRNGESDWKEGVETLYSLIEKKDLVMDPYELLVPYEGSDMNQLTYAMKLQPNPNELGTVRILHALVLYEKQQDDEVKGILWSENFWDEFKSILLMPEAQHAEGILIKRGLILPQ